MEPTDLTSEILRSIRDEVRGTNARIDETNTRIDETNTRIDETNTRIDETNTRLDGTIARLDRIERGQTESEIRTSTALIDLAGAVREVRDLLREDLGLSARVDDHEQRIRAIEKHSG